jgi:hypothetical protein
VDDRIKLNRESFKQNIDDLFKQEIITPLRHLTATPAFPTPDLLARFAPKAYKDYKTG